MKFRPFAFAFPIDWPSLRLSSSRLVISILYNEICWNGPNFEPLLLLRSTPPILDLPVKPPIHSTTRNQQIDQQDGTRKTLPYGDPLLSTGVKM